MGDIRFIKGIRFILIGLGSFSLLTNNVYAQGTLNNLGSTAQAVTTPNSSNTTNGSNGQSSTPNANSCSLSTNAQLRLQQQAYLGSIRAQAANFDAAACPSGSNSGSSGSGSSANATDTAQSALNSINDVVSSRRGGGNAGLSCLSATGTCPQIDLEYNVPGACTAFIVNGTFSTREFQKQENALARVLCAARCQVRNLNKSLEELACLKNQMNELKEGMNSVGQIIQDMLQCDTQVVAQIDANIEKYTQMSANIGNIVSSLQDQRTHLMEVIGKYSGKLEGCQNAIKSYSQRAQIYDRAIQRATVERGANCFLHGKPEGMAVGSCSLNGLDESTGFNSIMCRYANGIGANAKSTTVNGPARARAANFKNRLQSELSQYTGTGQINEEAGQRRVVTRDQMMQRLQSVVNQEGAGAAWPELQLLLNSCMDQQSALVTQEVSTPGGDADKMRTDRINAGNELMNGGDNNSCGGTGLRGMIGEYSEALRQAGGALYGSSWNDSNFNTADCTDQAVVNNSGTATIVQATLDTANRCVRSLNNIATGLANGTAIAGVAIEARPLPIQTEPQIKCAGLIDCIRQANERKGIMDRTLEQMKGDTNYTSTDCPSGCPGRKKYIKSATDYLNQGIRNGAQAFAKQTSYIAGRIRNVNNKLNNLHVTPLEIPHFSGQSDWQCPPGGRNTGEELCTMPEGVEFASVLGRRVSPNYDTNAAPGVIDSKIQELQGKLENVQSKLTNLDPTKTTELQALKQRCQAEAAAGQLQLLRNQLASALASCASTRNFRAQWCDDNGPGGRQFDALNRDFSDLEHFLVGQQAGTTEMANYQTKVQELATICGGGQRQPQDYQSGTNACLEDNDENRRQAAVSQACGATGNGNAVPVGASAADASSYTREPAPGTFADPVVRLTTVGRVRFNVTCFTACPTTGTLTPGQPAAIACTTPPSAADLASQAGCDPNKICSITPNRVTPFTALPSSSSDTGRCESHSVSSSAGVTYNISCVAAAPGTTAPAAPADPNASAPSGDRTATTGGGGSSASSSGGGGSSGGSAPRTYQNGELADPEHFSMMTGIGDSYTYYVNAADGTISRCPSGARFRSECREVPRTHVKTVDVMSSNGSEARSVTKTYPPNCPRGSYAVPFFFGTNGTGATAINVCCSSRNCNWEACNPLRDTPEFGGN